MKSNNDSYNYSIYTPKYIARDLVNRLFEGYFGNTPTIDKLNRVRACDLSCGNGHLIMELLERLIKLGHSLTGSYFYRSTWITCYDINQEALAILDIKSQDLFHKYGIDGKLELKCASSLGINARFNMIIGNPPYLGEKNNKELFQEIRKSTFGEKFYEAKMDYFYFFIEKAIDLLESNGVLAYITTNYWLKAHGATKLRSYLRDKGNFMSINNMGTSAFKSAQGQHNVIFSWIKSKDMYENVTVKTAKESFKISNNDIYDENGLIILANGKMRDYNDKIKEKANYILDDLVNINQGIVSGYDEAFILTRYRKTFGYFLKPFYKNSDIKRYKISKKNPYWILYLDGKEDIPPAIEKYLMQYQDKLMARREVGRGTISWWQLQWAREESIFCGPKILTRQRCKSNYFAYSDKDVYCSADVYVITAKHPDTNIFYILGYLNSKVFHDWYRNNGKSKGESLEFYTTPMKNTPIYYPKDMVEISYIEGLVKEQIEKFSAIRQKEINNYFKNKFQL